MSRDLIYRDDARKAVLKENPSVAYCVDNVKAVDAVEVVRCNDCKHYDYEYQLCTLHSIDPNAFSGGCDVDMQPDDFCSYGERREA